MEETLNVWLTEEQLEAISTGTQVHVERNGDCDQCGFEKELTIQIQKK